MKKLVRDVVIVSDGILIEFEAGECCYYPATFLLDHLLTESNHIFLNYDPCGGGSMETLALLPAVGNRILPRTEDISER